MRRLLPLLMIALALTALQLARAEVDEKRIAQLFRPPLGENMLLSQDGRYIAYTEHTGNDLVIIVLETERLRVSARIVADEDRVVVHSKERKRTELRFLGWSGSNRIVFAPSTEIIESAVQPPPPEILAALPSDGVPPPVIPRIPPRIYAPIFSVNADGSDPKTLADAATFEMSDMANDIPRMHMRAPEIRGFAAGDRDHLLLQIEGSDDSEMVVPREIFRLNVNTGKLDSLYREPAKRLYMYDRQGRARLVREDGKIRDEIHFLHRPPDGKKWARLGAGKNNETSPSFTTTVEGYFGSRAVPLGFDYDPNVLIYASNAGRNTYGVFGLDLTSGKRTSLALIHPSRDLVDTDALDPGAALVFDEHKQALAGVRSAGVRPATLWIDAELAEVQRRLEQDFPQRLVHIVSWADDRKRLLVRVNGGTDPGRLYLVKRPENVSVELMRRAPWLPNIDLHDTRFFEFQTKEGATLSGYLTLPRKPRLTPTPLVLCFAPGLQPRGHEAFDPQAQVLADIGFIVCRLNQRGVAGQGAAQRDALRHDIEGVPAADALAAIEWVAARHKVDRRRIAAMGEGVAGQYALRTAQLFPDTFSCVVAFEPVFDLATWLQPPADADDERCFEQLVAQRFFGEGKEKLEKTAATTHAQSLSHPVFMTVQTAATGADAHSAQVIAGGVSQLRFQLKRRDIPVTVIDIQPDFAAKLPKARARVYRELEEFFNLNLYNPKVKIGPTRVVK